MSVNPQVQAFRARFRDPNAADLCEASQGTPEERFTECLELHGLALWMDIERAMRDLGATEPASVLPEVNRRRREESPMPPSLRDRWRP